MGVLQFCKGDIYWYNFGESKDNLEGKARPCVIVSNDIGNAHSNIISVAPITTKSRAEKYHVEFKFNGQIQNILCEQIQTINKKHLKAFEGRLDEKTMTALDKALGVEFGLVLDSNYDHDIKMYSMMSSRINNLFSEIKKSLLDDMHHELNTITDISLEKLSGAAEYYKRQLSVDNLESYNASDVMWFQNINDVCEKYENDSKLLKKIIDKLLFFESLEKQGNDKTKKKYNITNKQLYDRKYNWKKWLLALNIDVTKFDFGLE